MIKPSITAFLFVLTILFGFSQDFDKAKLDTYFETLDKKAKFMGSVAISENGKLIYSNQWDTFM